MGGGRFLARRCAVQALYQWQMTGQAAAEIETSFISNESLEGAYLEYFKDLIKAIPENVGKVDALLTPHLDRKVEKVDVIELAILRVGAYELAFQPDVPTRVVLDEAIELAKIFGSENGYRFVNGILDKVAAVARNDSKNSN